MKKLLLTGILLFSLTSFAGNDKEKAVSKTVSGKITDSTGEAIPGAKLYIHETGESVFADFEGNFTVTLKTDKEYTLHVNSIGYQPALISSVQLTNFTDLVLKAL